MNSAPETFPLPVATDAPKAAEHDALKAQARQRLEHLFRDSVRKGSLNPLMHLVARYRLDTLQ